MKKNIVIVFVFSFFAFSVTSGLAKQMQQFSRKQAVDISKVFQVATMSSLAQGVYDGDYDFGQLMQHGNFGLGTFLDLNGEMVAIDGQFYQIEASGKLKLAQSNQIVPFAEVAYFKPTIFTVLNKVANYQVLGNDLLKLFPKKNIPYAIRIDGEFNALKLRSLRKQKKPYPNLLKASSKQAIFNLEHVKGSIVGFWFPQYWAGIAVPGFHLHFVTRDRKTGGHVLGVDVKHAKVSIQPLHSVEVYLPNTKSFSEANLSAEDLHASIHKAEGGANQ